jgi:multiple sugar transport system permease protein
VDSTISLAPAGRRAVRGRTPRHQGADRLWRHLTLAPALALFGLLTVAPMVSLVVLSFSSVVWSGGGATWSFVAAANFLALATDTLFRAGIWNTVVFAAVGVTLQVVIGFALALLVSSVVHGRTTYRALFLLPILVPGIVIGAIWKLMYSFDFGVINLLAGLLGLPAQDWLGQSNLALGSVIVVDVWHWMPFCFLLLLAGIESLPQDVFEAARIDGATGWQSLLYVTLPLMAPVIAVTFTFRLILAFKVFDEVYLLTGGGPGTSTEVVSFTIYRRFFTEDRPGYGAAMSLVTFLAITLLIVFARRLGRHRREA